MKKFTLDQFLVTLQLVGPSVLAAVPGGQKIAPLIPTITGAIAEAQAIAGATGAEKKAHVENIVAAGVVTANATGRVALDPVAVSVIVGNGIDAVIGALRLLEQLHVTRVPGPIATAAELGAPAGSTGE
jgi:hypothetical protein